MSNFQAAISLTQLKELEKMNKYRIRVSKKLSKYIEDEVPLLDPPIIQKNVKHVFLRYVVRIQ